MVWVGRGMVEAEQPSDGKANGQEPGRARGLLSAANGPWGFPSSGVGR